jgi:hypothetical protein
LQGPGYDELRLQLKIEALRDAEEVPVLLAGNAAVAFGDAAGMDRLERRN